MKALFAVLVVALAPVHIRFAGVPVSLSVGWLILAAEVLVATMAAWAAVRVIRRFRSAPWLRFNGAMP